MAEIAQETLEKYKKYGHIALTAQHFRRRFHQQFLGGGTSRIGEILANDAGPANETDNVKRLHCRGHAGRGCHRSPPGVPGRA